MVRFPYYSHTTPIRIPKDMGIVWEACHKGAPGITIDLRFFAEVALLMTHVCQYWYTGEGKSPIDNIIPTSQANIQSIIQ